MINKYLFMINYAPCVGIVFLFIFLSVNSTLDRNLKKIFYLLLTMEFIEMVAYSLELIVSQWSYPSDWRILLSAIGYSVRPFLAYLVFRLCMRNQIPKAWNRVLLIPLILNMILAFSAFWSDIVYSYTSDNVFKRGPLGHISSLTISFYFILLVVITIKELRCRGLLETFIIIANVFLILMSMVIEAVFYMCSIGRCSIVLATVFYYMFFQTQEYKESMNEDFRIRQKLEQKTKTDRLTNMLNKYGFLEETTRVLQCNREGNVALIFFDLDNFKEVNDSMGHVVGDKVLHEVARKLKIVFKKNGILGRFGGDEFYALVENVSYDELMKMVQDALVALQMQYSHDIGTVTITASIGAAFITKDIQIESLELLELADSAAYEAKNQGKNQYVIKHYNKSRVSRV